VVGLKQCNACLDRNLCCCNVVLELARLLM
jgi:hypothetical protein